jgi:hypothetical protein
LDFASATDARRPGSISAGPAWWLVMGGIQSAGTDDGISAG